MKIVHGPFLEETYDSSGTTWVPVAGIRSIPEGAILYTICGEDGCAVGNLLVDTTCSATRECSLTILDMACEDGDRCTADEVLRTFEAQVGEHYEAVIVELSALYEEAMAFWQRHGYAQIADLRHEADDVTITLGKLLPKASS